MDRTTPEKVPRCHNTPMEYEAGDTDDAGNYGEWLICRHCGCVKDMRGNKIQQS